MIYLSVCIVLLCPASSLMVLSVSLPNGVNSVCAYNLIALAMFLLFCTFVFNMH